MDPILKNAFISSVERLNAWTDLLDRINVFPVADGDTGRNLKITLNPIKQLENGRRETIQNLLYSASGNSGNIAACYISGLLSADSEKQIPPAEAQGRKKAWTAIQNPRSGTMLSVFDAFSEIYKKTNFTLNKDSVSNIIGYLIKTVRETSEKIPELKHAGVVDSGALGMFIYLESFLKSIIGQTDDFLPIIDTFQGRLSVSKDYKIVEKTGYCVDAAIRLKDNSEKSLPEILNDGESIVGIPTESYVKIHLHTDNADKIKKRIETFGKILKWSDDDIGEQIQEFKQHDLKNSVHIMTDAAGSMRKKDRLELGITLLDSYIMIGDKSFPETTVDPKELYGSMKKGIKITTAQASVFERHQHYQSVLNQYKKVLYLSVGSVFTGNFAVAMDWKLKNDTENRLTVIDTAAASGRLGNIAIATAKFSATDKNKNHDDVYYFAHNAIAKCKEYIFLEKLQYLARGGRLSKTSAFFGDVLHIKPIISPTAKGAVKVGVARNKKEQIKFALERLSESMSNDSNSLIMLEYSDNEDYVRTDVKKEIEREYASAKIILTPLSITSGAHMGPGTWGISFLPK